MWIWLLAAQALARPLVALEVTDPAGAEVFNAEVDIGHDQRIEYSDGSRSWRLYLSTRFEGNQVEVEGRLEEVRGRSPVTRETRSVALAEHATGSLDLGWKKLEGTFDVQTQWARSVNPRPSGPLPGGRARFALVWDDADLLQHPRNQKDARHRRELADGRSSPAAQVAPYRVVHTHSETWVEVEEVGNGPATHCYTPAPADAPLPRRQHYVRGSDLVQVTTRPVNASFEDGSGYSLAAGVAVVPLGDGRYEAHAGELRIPVRLDEEEVGTRYRPTSLWPVVDNGQRLTPTEGVLGELPLGPVRWEGDEGGPVVQGRTGVRSPVVTLRHRCAEVHLVVPSQRLQGVRTER